MPLNTAGLTAFLDLGNATTTWAAISTSTTAAGEVSEARVRVDWSVPVSQVISALNVPLSFKGPASSAATHMLLFDSPSGGVLYGYVALDGDQAFSATGDFDITAAALTASVPPGIPDGFPNEFNTGLAGVGMTEADLTPYTGPDSYHGSQTVTITGQLINTDLQIFDTVQLTFSRCKLNGHIDIDAPGAHVTLLDCHVDAGTWSNQAVGFRQLTIARCDIQGADTSVNGADSVTITDSYLHGQVIDPTGSQHANAFLCSGGGNVQIDHCTIWGSVLDNGFGGGATASLSLFGDFAALNNITIHDSYFPVTPGGYSVSLGYNPGKPFGSNPTNIVFTDNVLARNPNTGHGGAFGTITSFLDTEPTNIYTGNVWADDGTPVPVNQ
jgi:hypothetical protein